MLVVVDCVAVLWFGVGSMTAVQLGRTPPQAIAIRPRVINDGFMVMMLVSSAGRVAGWGIFSIWDAKRCVLPWDSVTAGKASQPIPYLPFG